jgi:hypothetical protein
MGQALCAAVASLANSGQNKPRRNTIGSLSAEFAFLAIPITDSSAADLAQDQVARDLKKRVTNEEDTGA